MSLPAAVRRDTPSRMACAEGRWSAVAMWRTICYRGGVSGQISRKSSGTHVAFDRLVGDKVMVVEAAADGLRT